MVKRHEYSVDELLQELLNFYLTWYHHLSRQAYQLLVNIKCMWLELRAPKKSMHTKLELHNQQ